MTNEQNQVKQFMTSFGQEVPNKPTIPSLEVRKLRAKLILEEALETIRDGLGIDVIFDDFKNDTELLSSKTAKFIFEEANGITPSLELIADGCEDLKVVTEGCLVACGLIDLPRD